MSAGARATALLVQASVAKSLSFFSMQVLALTWRARAMGASSCQGIHILTYEGLQPAPREACYKPHPPLWKLSHRQRN
jgi:hypothetical protein